MDEGFTSYASTRVMHHLFKGADQPVSFRGQYNGFSQWVQSGKEEALSTHSDHFVTNRAYGVAAYTKGSIFLNQLEYVIGKKAFDQGMLRYYNEWKYKHPDANDFIRVMEKQSGLELDWYREYWVNTTHFIDYALDDLQMLDKDNSTIKLKRQGYMPAPLDVVVTTKDGMTHCYNIPLRIMRGNKPNEGIYGSYEILQDWPWTNTEYNFSIPFSINEITSVSIDPSGRLADIFEDNNTRGIQ
jgi:hypothetical protein